MICLFADLSFSLCFNASRATQKFPARFSPAPNFRANDRTFAIRYRDCNSNPKAANLAAVLSAALPTSRYAHPIGFEIRCAQPVKHPDPYLAFFSPLRRSPHRAFRLRVS
jgi:hypothetical protein